MTELQTLAAWLQATPPPAGPLVLQVDRLGQAVVTVADPARCWTYYREQLAEGLRGQNARGVLLFLRKLKESYAHQCLQQKG